MSVTEKLIKYYDETKSIRKDLQGSFRKVVEHLEPLGVDVEMEQCYDDYNYYMSVRATVCGFNPTYSDHPSKEDFVKLVNDFKSHREKGLDDEVFFENNDIVNDSNCPADLEELVTEVIAHNIDIDILYDFIDSVEYGIEEWVVPDLN